jgi:hypothetical protein
MLRLPQPRPLSYHFRSRTLGEKTRDTRHGEATQNERYRDTGTPLPADLQRVLCCQRHLLPGSYRGHHLPAHPGRCAIAISCPHLPRRGEGALFPFSILSYLLFTLFFSPLSSAWLSGSVPLFLQVYSGLRPATNRPITHTPGLDITVLGSSHLSFTATPLPLL